MSTQESSADLRAQKRAIQAAFIESCKARGLTPYEALREASFLPLDLKPTDIKVVKWPRFR